MLTLVDKEGRESLTKCYGCGVYRLCREYEDMWLCVSGPAKCWRQRQSLVLIRELEDEE